MEDRRKHQRFKLKDGCIINHSKVVGTIADISMGGLSCTCLDVEQCQQQRVPRVVDIYCRNGNLRVEKVKIQILDSKFLPGQFAERFGVRKCRIRFEQLQQEQMSQLENIIIQSVLPSSPAPPPDITL